MVNKAVVIGKDHHNALGIVESLGAKGIRPYVVILTCYKKSFVAQSKFVEQGWCCPNEASVINTLLTYFVDKENKAVAFTCDDESAVILDRNYALLESILYIPTVKPAGTLSTWMQKDRMSKLAEEVGMTVPKTWISCDNEIPCGVEYPVITKAHSSVEGGKDNLHICHNAAELKKVMNQEHCSTMVVQQYIDKLFEFQLIGYSGGEIVIPGRTEIVRPEGIDNTFFLKYDRCEQFYESLVERAKAFIRSTGYVGLFSMEFLCDKRGEAYFTEMNFRNDGNAICVTAFGVNLPYIMYLDRIGEKIGGETLVPYDAKAVWLCPELYFTRVLAGEVGLWEYMANLRKTTCSTICFKGDRRPFWKFLQYGIEKRLKRLI